MPRRLNTIIIVPHSKARFFKISFSTRALVGVSCVATLAVVLSIIAIAFTGSAVNRRLEVQRVLQGVHEGARSICSINDWNIINASFLYSRSGSRCP